MIKIILIIVAVFIVYCLIEMIRELRDFRVTKYRICSQKLNGIKREKKIIFLSDLHNRMYGEENERLLESIRNQHPDLILIGGDMLVRKDGNSYDKTVHFLAKLPGICPVYCANGNHEQKLKELPDKYEQSYEEYKKALTASGIHMLENASETVKLDEVPVKLSGLEIPLGAYARFGKKELSLKEITDRIGEHGDDYQILLGTSSGIYERISGIWGRSDPGRALSRLCGTTPGDRWSHFDEFYTVSKVFRGNLPGRRTDSSCKPRTWDAFGAVKTVELAGADCSGIIRK